MWRSDFDALGLGPLADGVQVVAAGGCDYYPGSRTASPAFSFAVSRLRIAGEGDLLAQLEQLRRALHGEGLFAHQKQLPRPALPRTIGVVCGEHGKARDDLLAALGGAAGAGGVVWAFAPVQDRHAAPAITRALQDLAACTEVEAIVVARGGGSLADLFAFCDETLCRTVALLRVPVISSVGHHTDRTLLDDVAAVACSTPTHAAEAAVPLDCVGARRDAARGRRPARAPEPARDRRARPHARAPVARPGRARRAPPHAAAPAPARAARERAPRHRRRRARGSPTRRRCRARPRPPSSPRARATGAHGSGAALDRGATAAVRAAGATSSASPSRWPPTIRSTRSSAATRSSRTAPASRVTSAAAAREQRSLVLRLHDGRVPVRPEPPVD